MKTGEFDPAAGNPYRSISKDHIRSAAHLELTRQVAAKSLVLLENKKSVLPLRADKRYNITVVGPFADCEYLSRLLLICWVTIPANAHTMPCLLPATLSTNL